MSRAPTAPSPRPAARRGDVFWLDAPLQDSADQSSAAVQDASVAHPHLVVSDDVFNLSRVHTVIVCALTSNLHRAHEPGNVLLDVGEGDLPRQSVVVVSQISSIEKARLGGYIGALSSRRVEQVLDGLGFQQRAFFAERG